jgi:hypothetical protein
VKQNPFTKQRFKRKSSEEEWKIRIVIHDKRREDLKVWKKSNMLAFEVHFIIE